MDIKDLHGHLTEATTEVKGLVERQSEEIKALGKSTDVTAMALKDAEARMDSINEDLAGRLENVEKHVNRPGGGYGTDEAKSAGAQFVESDIFKNARAMGSNSTERFELKDITSAANSAGAIAVSQRDMRIYRDPADRPTHLRDVMDVQQTESGSIEFYVDHGGFSNEAGPQDGELASKAKSGLVLEEKVSPVKTIAHHVIASRQVLDDAPMLRGYIDGRLSYGLRLEEDRQILYGDGTGGSLTGIFNTAGVQDHGSLPSNTDLVTHVRRAMTKARLSEYPVTGILMNPADWENVELTKSDDGHYIWAWYMASNGESRLWRVPVIETTAIEAGDFLLGNFSMAATLWDRQQASIRVSDSHQDLFTRNGVAILGEERVALAVQRPKAFVKGSTNGD